MKSLEDYIATLSPEEREQYKDLIEECVTREKEIVQAGNIMREKLPKLFMATEKIVQNLEAISEKTNQLHHEAKILKERTDRKILAEIPDEEFFVA